LRPAFLEKETENDTDEKQGSFSHGYYW